MLGVCYILSTTSGGVTGGATPPCTGPGAVPREIFFGPYIAWVNLPMVLCMGFSHGFGHDDFLPVNTHVVPKAP